MKKPSTKPIVRVQRDRKLPPLPNGKWTDGIHNPEFATLLGAIASRLPHIEERMIGFLSRIMELDGEETIARQIFRSLASERARIQIMKALLENAIINKDKPSDFDEVINLFDSVTNQRNKYVHGLWFTHESGRVFLSKPTTDLGAIDKAKRREVSDNELKDLLRRMDELIKKIEKSVTWSPPGAPPRARRTSVVGRF